MKHASILIIIFSPLSSTSRSKAFPIPTSSLSLLSLSTAYFLLYSFSLSFSFSPTFSLHTFLSVSQIQCVTIISFSSFPLLSQITSIPSPAFFISLSLSLSLSHSFQHFFETSSFENCSYSIYPNVLFAQQSTIWVETFLLWFPLIKHLRKREREREGERVTGRKEEKMMKFFEKWKGNFNQNTIGKNVVEILNCVWERVNVWE